MDSSKIEDQISEEEIEELPTAREVELPDGLRWKVFAHNQIVEKKMAEISRAETLLEMARLQEQMARDELQNAIDELKDSVEVPQGYEMTRLALDRGVGVCERVGDD